MCQRRPVAWLFVMACLLDGRLVVVSSRRGDWDLDETVTFSEGPIKEEFLIALDCVCSRKAPRKLREIRQATRSRLEMLNIAGAAGRGTQHPIHFSGFRSAPSSSHSHVEKKTDPRSSHITKQGGNSRSKSDITPSRGLRKRERKKRRFLLPCAARYHTQAAAPRPISPCGGNL